MELEDVFLIMQDVVNKKGEGYLKNHSYDVFLHLIKKGIDEGRAAAVFSLLVNETPTMAKHLSREALSLYIQKNCLFKESVANDLAFLMKSLIKEEPQYTTLKNVKLNHYYS